MNSWGSFAGGGLRDRKAKNSSIFGSIRHGERGEKLSGRCQSAVHLSALSTYRQLYHYRPSAASSQLNRAQRLRAK